MIDFDISDEDYSKCSEKLDILSVNLKKEIKLFFDKININSDLKNYMIAAFYSDLLYAGLHYLFFDRVKNEEIKTYILQTTIVNVKRILKWYIRKLQNDH